MRHADTKMIEVHSHRSLEIGDTPHCASAVQGHTQNTRAAAVLWFSREGTDKAGLADLALAGLNHLE